MDGLIVLLSLLSIVEFIALRLALKAERRARERLALATQMIGMLAAQAEAAATHGIENRWGKAA